MCLWCNLCNYNYGRGYSSCRGGCCFGRGFAPLGLLSGCGSCGFGSCGCGSCGCGSCGCGFGPCGAVGEVIRRTICCNNGCGPCANRCCRRCCCSNCRGC